MQHESTPYSDVKCLILDVDGVFTDGRKAYDINGNVVSKQFLDKDFTALNMLSEYFLIVILSGDDRVNKPLFESKGIPFFHSRSKGKKKLLKVILNKYNIGPNNCIFVGDDFPDIPCFRSIPLSFCPSDAVYEIKSLAYKTLGARGGTGVIVDLYHELSSEIMLRRKYGY